MKKANSKTKLGTPIQDGASYVAVNDCVYVCLCVRSKVCCHAESCRLSGQGLKDYQGCLVVGDLQ